MNGLLNIVAFKQILRDDSIILGSYPERLYHGVLPDRPAAPPAPPFASTLPLASANYLRESLGGYAIPGGPTQPARLRASLALHEGRGVLLTPPADRGGEDGGVVSEHRERGGRERPAGGE